MDRKEIRGLRINLGLSQEGFARLVGVSMQTVRRWESGLARPLPIINLSLEEIRRKAQQITSSEGGTTVREERDRKKAVVDVELGGLGGLFKGVGGLLELVAKMTEEGKEETTRTGQVEAMGGKMKGVYGFTVRLGLGGKPVVEQFGNIRETPSGAVVAETREPLVDVLDEGDHILVIAEMPGVDEGDVRVKVEGDILEIAASRGARQYRKEVLLPTAAAPENVATSYRNGILEVRLSKIQPGQG